MLAKRGRDSEKISIALAIRSIDLLQKTRNKRISIALLNQSVDCYYEPNSASPVCMILFSMTIK